MNSNSITKILVADTADNTHLLKEALREFATDFHLDMVERISDILLYLNRDTAFLPSFIIIGSGLLINEGRDAILDLKTEAAYYELPFIILTEFEEEKYLVPEKLNKLLFIKRPFTYEHMAHMIRTIFEAAANINPGIKTVEATYVL